MHNRFVTFLTALLLVLAMRVPVWAQGAGVIEGQVFNGTSEGVPLEGLPAILWIISGEEVEGSLEETTDDEGLFRFQDLDTEGYLYQFEVEYQGVSYGSEIMAFPEGENILSIPFTVFEPTTSDAELWVERAHLILDFDQGAILAQEVQIFVNGGNTTYIGSTGEEGGATLHFPLPQGASGVQLIEGLMACCVLETERGIASDRPVFPGSDQIVFSYEVDYQSPAYTLSKGIAYPTHSLDVLIADVGVEVTAPGLTVEEPLALESGRYLHLAAQDLTPADELTLNLANMPLGVPEDTPAPSAAAGPDLFGWLVVILVTLAVGLALGYPLIRKRQEEES